MEGEIMTYEEWLESDDRLYHTNEATIAKKAIQSGEDILVNMERQRRDAYASYLKAQKQH